MPLRSKIVSLIVAPFIGIAVCVSQGGGPPTKRSAGTTSTTRSTPTTHPILYDEKNLEYFRKSGITFVLLGSQGSEISVLLVADGTHVVWGDFDIAVESDRQTTHVKVQIPEGGCSLGEAHLFTITVPGLSGDSAIASVRIAESNLQLK